MVKPAKRRVLKAFRVSDEPYPDMPFAEGNCDELGADLRHRLISDAAYTRYCERGYADGYDLDDWLEAEAAVDHMLLNRAERDASA